MYCLALTGGIACGKSLFGRLLADCGAEVRDADELVHELHQAGGAAAKAVRDNFGSEYLRPDGSTDRARLGSALFANREMRFKLEQILHPLVRDTLLQWKASPSEARLRVAQIPLLHACGWANDWDGVATVEAPEALRFERLCARGIPADEARARIASQWTSAARIAQSNFVIHNDGSPEDLRHLAQSLYDTLSK